MKLSTTEANCLIAVFMGATEEQWYPYNKDFKTSGIYYAFPRSIIGEDGKQKEVSYPANEKYVGDTFLKYHKDYNWFIQAWIRFRDLKIIKCFQFDHTVFKSKISTSLTNISLEEAYKVLVEAIEWYNEIKDIT